MANGPYSIMAAIYHWMDDAYDHCYHYCHYHYDEHYYYDHYGHGVAAAGDGDQYDHVMAVVHQISTVMIYGRLSRVLMMTAMMTMLMTLTVIVALVLGSGWGLTLASNYPVNNRSHHLHHYYHYYYYYYYYDRYHCDCHYDHCYYHSWCVCLVMDLSLQYPRVVARHGVTMVVQSARLDQSSQVVQPTRMMTSVCVDDCLYASYHFYCCWRGRCQ